MSANPNNATVYMDQDVRKKLHVKPYGDRGTTEAMKMVIERYFALLNTETKRVNAMFTAEEWNALYNAASSTSWNTGSIRQGMTGKIIDSLPAEITAYGADRNTLIDKLKKLTPVQDFCLVEQVEAYWLSK